MCFYNDDCDVAEIWKATIVNRCRKQRKCSSCARVIDVGESLMSVFTVLDGDANTSCFCNQCCQDWVSIHRVELVKGCADYESWCNPWDINAVIRGVSEGSELEEHRDLPFNQRYMFGPVLEWPYWVAPATLPIDLKTLPDLLEHLGLAKREAT